MLFQAIIFVFLIIFILVYSFQNSWIWQKRVINPFLVISILFVNWLGLVFYQAYQIENVFTVLTTEYSRRQLKTFKEGEIYQGEKIIGEFKAENNYLGIVGFRFWTFYRLNDDFLIFRIREKNSTDWYYQAEYKTDQFQPNQYFTFGFPPIYDSAGKIFEFEIESTKGRPDMAVGISDMEPIFIVKYKYPRDEITQSYKQFLAFLVAKSFNLAGKVQFTGALYVYLLPPLLYLLTVVYIWELLGLKFKMYIGSYFSFLFKLLYAITDLLVNKPKTVSLFLLIVANIVDIFLITKGDLPFLVLIIIWLAVGIKYTISEKYLFLLAMVSLVISLLAFYLKLMPISERAGIWVWGFWVMAVVFILTRSSKISTAKG